MQRARLDRRTAGRARAESDLDLLDEIPAGAGAIGLFSSDEFLPGALPFDRVLIDATGPTVALLLCADHRNATVNARHAAHHFGALGARTFPLSIEHFPARATAPLPDFDLLYIPGGSPADLLACVRGSVLWDLVLERWRAGAGLAGSSAGAMALCVHCMAPRPGDSHPTTWTRGLGPLQLVALAVHATTRPRAWLHKMATVGDAPVLAIDDSTGVLLQAGARPRVIGPGEAWIVEKDGKNR